MSNEKIKELLQDKDQLANENAALRQENAELKSKQAQYLNTIREQGAELEKLLILARTVENHFIENGPGWQVERCVGCGKCEYVLLEEALVKALGSDSKFPHEYQK